ncbi:Soluble lytic murein transglycosylase precursor [hydrothermal vent metagenome]|uniref:Soluble lytic murein transglycosylase n=1 Tax=hydrothermal vent metagenome TaxID=652676 RepID=A0A3B0WCK9_9ZZZZ
MKKKLILISCAALLISPSAILSQATEKISDTTVSNAQGIPFSAFANSSPAIKKTDKDQLILAKVSNIDNKALNNNENNKSHNKKEAIIETSLPSKHFSEEELTHLRQLFLQAENALKKKNTKEYFLLSEQLKDYPLYPYLQYQFLKKHLNREKDIQQFLQQHSSSRYANKLKRKWLYYLGKRNKWSLIHENNITTKNTTLNCYFLRAQIHSGEKQTALIAAKDLWAVGRSQPRACNPLFSQLKKSKYFTQELRWQRFDAALQNNKVSLASYVKNLMPKKYHATAQLWINLHRNPSRYLPRLLKYPQSDQFAAMFRHGIKQLARKDVTKAIEIWDVNKQLFAADETLAADNLCTNKSVTNKLATNKLERRLAFKLLYKGEPDAYDRLGQLDSDIQDSSSRTSRIRIALSEQNWENVLIAIHDLSDEEKTQDKWQYWLARAYMETDEVAMAQALFSELATKRSFYGFLAADKVDSIYELSDTPVNVSVQDIIALKNRKEFRVAFEFMMLGRKNKAKLQWWHASHQLNKNEILIAAKLAQQWQWNEIAIFTIAKAKYWDDIDVRFPLNYIDKIHENSTQHNLNPVILYGLIRRESAFNERARSPSGARGLMQIMPRTGKDIARNLNERWRGNSSLYNPITNIKYGAYYYQKLLTQFDGHYALALAAYNAGPNRVKKWLPEAETLPADIWIETIPYKETREYVVNVLAYALIYQQRAQQDNRPIFNKSDTNLSMNDLARDVVPLP